MLKLFAFLIGLFPVFLPTWMQLIFFASFSCYIDNFSYAFPRDLVFFSWKKLLKWLALLFLVKLNIYFLYVLTLFTSSSLFNGFFGSAFRCDLLAILLPSQYPLDVCVPVFVIFNFAEVSKHLDFFIVYLFSLKFH